MVKAIVAAAVAAVCLSAAEAELKGQMDAMRDNMIKIQDGFFYNDKGRIIEGIDAIEAINSTHLKKDVAGLLPDDKKHMVGIAMKMSQKTATGLKKLKAAVASNSFANAADAYADMVHSCTSCHAIIRGW